MTKQEWRKFMLLRSDQKICFCYLCGKIIKPKDLSLDHVIPLSRGGADNEYNWKESHRKCNSTKGALTYEEYVQWKLMEAKRYGHIK